MSDVFLMGCGAGFSGDRVDAPVSVVNAIAASGKPGAIMFETLGERTLALGQVARRADPTQGYEPLLAELVGPILPICARHRIPIVSNFGAANPAAAVEVIRKLAVDAGIRDLKIACIEGDDIRDTIDLDKLQVWEGDASLVGPASEVISANVYLGAQSIAEALRQGAQVVVGGRIADPALALGPLVAHFGWAWDDWNRLAAGTLAGHLLECGAQVTGGYFADPGYKDVPNPENIGFPIAEVSADGAIVMTKAAGTGGIVSAQTVKEQALYEMHDPSTYLTPDVTLDITGVEVAEIGPDRVSVRGAKGRPKPPTLKATVCFPGDWLGEAEISYAGPNALARARLAGETIRKRLAMRDIKVRARVEMIGALSALDSDNSDLARGLNADLPELRLRLAVSAGQKRPVDQALQEVLALYCCGPAAGGGVRSRTQNRIKTVSYLVPREAVKPRLKFTVSGGA